MFWPAAKVARVVDLEGGERTEEDMAHAELGGVAQGDLIAFEAAEEVATAAGEEGAARPVGVLGVDEDVATEPLRLMLPLPLMTPLRVTGPSFCRIQVQALEVGGAFDPDVVAPPLMK